MWSMGCIMYELLNYTLKDENKYTNKYLFEGTSCFPLSPCGQDKDLLELHPSRKNDQLLLILQKLGPQAYSNESLSFLTTDWAIEYIKNLTMSPIKNE